ncbi:tricarballylate utilization 4Fe-4S protein TcuB [Insolitispirillum peregrinum]|uniref:Citrate/tricarballylate utilization protein n=1 Tax=Insolitispirillum peregrinum TaxID=80876 RepID=A0A1N7NVD6_9PROT|nr:tricarballylate utilization 4Fe-4S protein TcuB [Insolitispirillum peregrinum]SIT02252.1 citrate/tricarballylate utilization protein [Insolitispirillum peregrinum]
MSLPDPARDDLAEARRILTLCMVCNYCNGVCDMFRMTHQLKKETVAGTPSDHAQPLGDGQLIWLAHLCHDCRTCGSVCQYAPPHPFAVTVPRTLARLRQQSWRDRPWIAWSVVVLVPLLTLLLVPWNILFARHLAPGAFYAVLPWSALCAVAGVPLLWSVLSLWRDLRRFWRASGGGTPSLTALLTAGKTLITLRPLRGTGLACANGTARRRSHHLLVSGFLLCFAATVIATLYHHLLGWQAPYPLDSLPVVLGSTGGVAMIAGSSGMLWYRPLPDPAVDPPAAGLTLPVLLFAIAATGLALLLWRETAAMGILLAVHMGCVAGFFATLGQGKFAHAPYRAAAVLRAALERHNGP